MKNFFKFVTQKAFSSNDLIGVVCGVAILTSGAFAFGFLMEVLFQYPLVATPVFFAAMWGYIYNLYRKQK
jgi:hypothetical protein